MTTIIVSEDHQYDESRNIVIYSNGVEKNYDDIGIKIDIYQTRVNGWFFSVAEKLITDGMSPGDYVCVMVALSYLEGVQQFREGKETPKRKSGEWFKTSASRVFYDQPAAVIDRLWEEARCGLFHAGFTNGKVYLSHNAMKAIELKNDSIHINPKKFLKCVSEDFSKYVSDLRDETSIELRKNFENLWDDLWSKS